jgi:hypothetical protein
MMQIELPLEIPLPELTESGLLVMMNAGLVPKEGTYILIKDVALSHQG